MTIIVCANIGLGGTESESDFQELDGVGENVRRVWRNVHDRITAIRHKWNAEPGILAVQEDGGYGYEFEPFFSKPLVTDYDVNVGTQGRGRRGVSTYCRLNDGIRVDPIDNTNEITTMIFSYADRNGRRRKAGFVNFYRNQHKVYGRSVNDTVTALKKTIKNLRTKHEINNVIVQGDLNDEGNVFLGPLFNELTHPDLFHKANHNARKTKIDRIWSNFKSCGILDINQTAENKSDNNNKELGHKTISIWVGKKPKLPEKKRVNMISLKKLKEAVRGVSPKFSLDDNFIAMNPNDIDSLIEDFMNVMSGFAESATRSVEVKNISADKIFLNDIELAEQDILHGKKESKTLYRGMSKMRNGLEDITSTEKPSLEKLGQKLEKKLEKLNDCEHQTAKKVVDEMFKPNPGISCKLWSSLDEFKRICHSTSNSSAKDNVGLSLVMTKIFLDNRMILRRYESILKACLEIGYFPKDWKQDLIHFIFKNKGLRSDAANWRPITIASSFGKHFEKTISYMIAGMDDRNYDNHAYKSKKACLTAITMAQRTFLTDKLKSAGIDMKGKKVITSISLDDISGAFESVDHIILGYAFELIFRKETRFDIKGIILSYLNRKATITGDDEDTYALASRALRSIPQGSILSPLLWRLFDGIFTQLYKNSFPEIMEVHKDILAITHLAYADDHMTIFSIIADANSSFDEIGERLSEIFDMLRLLLKSATKTLGSDINPKKSESIVLKDLTPFIILEDKTDKDPANSFKWLGYHMILNDDMLLEFDEAKIKITINAVNSFRKKAYSYTASIAIRWKVYKVYIAPFIELFLPLVIQLPSSGPKSITIIHDLQHHSLCYAMGLPWTTGRRTIEKFLGEKSIEEKAQRMANRLIEANKLERPKFSDNDEEGMELRSKNKKWFPIEKKRRNEFIVRLFMFSDFKIEETPKIKFNISRTKKWCIATRLAIQKHACSRSNS